MTLSELHQIPGFSDLFNDARLKAALIHLRERFPRSREANGDEWRGRHDVLIELENLKTIPKSFVDESFPKSSRYPNPNPNK